LILEELLLLHLLLLLFLLLLLELDALLLLGASLLILDLLLLLFEFVDLIEYDTKTFIKETLKLLIILQIELNEGRFGGVPALSRIFSFFVFLEKITHLSFDRFLRAFWEKLIEVIDDLLFTLKGPMHDHD
jgi:hypothetical protein